MVATLRIALLGEPHFAYGDDPFSFEALPRALPLLAYLILNRAEPVHHDTVAALFWPDDADSDARVKLRRHLYSLRTALPPTDSALPWTLDDSTMLQWNAAAPATADVIAFERDAADPATYEDAVAGYGGDLLVGFSDTWLLAERGRLRHLYLERREVLLAHAEEEGRLPDALRHARALLAADPWREQTVRALMRIYSAAGDPVRVRMEYERYARDARRQRGIAPTAQTQVLVHELAPESQPPHTQSFEDGEPLRQRLFDLVDAAREGRGSLVVVSGEHAAVGTRFAEAFADGVPDARIFIGPTSDPERHPYEALAEIVKTALPLVRAGRSPGQLAALASLVPEVGRPTRRSHSSDLGRERTRLFDAIVGAIEALARERLIVLILPDFQRAGAASRASLELLARRLSTLSVLAIVTRSMDERARELESIERRLRESGLVTSLRARASAVPDEVHDPAHAVERDDAIGVTASDRAMKLFADDDALSIIARAQQRPLSNAAHFAFLIQRELIASDRSNRDEHLRILAELDAVALDPRQQARVLQLRIRFTRKYGLREEHERLVDAFATIATMTADDRLIVNADLLRGRLYLDAQKYAAARRALMESADRALEMNDAVAAYKSLFTLAQMESTLGNGAAAQDFLKRADREAEHAGDSLARARIVTATIAMHLRDMRMTEAIAAADAAHPLFAALGDRESYADMLSQVARAQTRIGNVDAALAIYAETAAIYAQLDVPQGEAKTLINSSIALARLGRYDEALASAERAAAIFERIGDIRGQAICIGNAGLIAYYRHRYDEAVGEYERALALAETLNNDDIVSNILSNIGAAESARGNYDRAIDFLERGIRMATAGDRVLSVVNDIPDLVLAYVRNGDSRRAEMTSRTMFEVVARLTDPYDELFYVEYVAGLVDDRRGRLSSARAHYEAAERLFQERVKSFSDEGARAAFFDLPNSRLIREGLKLR